MRKIRIEEPDWLGKPALMRKNRIAELDRSGKCAQMRKQQRLLQEELMRQFVKFNLVGLLNTALDFVLFSLLTWFGVFYIWAQCISYVLGTINSYTLNKYWTFTQKGRLEPKQAMRFLVLNLGSLLLSLGMLAFLSDYMGINVLVAKLITTTVTTLFNYAGNKLWVFRTSETKYS
jgi:putative flippase GtrA